MNLLKAFIDWILKKPCATPSCTHQVSRRFRKNLVVIIGDEKRIYEQNGIFCEVCHQQQLHEMPLQKAIQLTTSLPTGRTWIGEDLDF